MQGAPDPRFYVTGGSLPREATSYAVRDADRLLLSELQAGQFCYVLDTRQVGKSSLMVRTASRLRELGATVVILDLTSAGQNVTIDQWYAGLLFSIGSQTGAEDELDRFWTSRTQLGPAQRWFAAIQSVLLGDQTPDRPIIIFVDEIDVVRGLPFSVDEFFAAIRECANRRTYDMAMRRLTFCLLGVAAPTDLVRNPQITPFNVGRRIDLHDFDEDEARPLANGLPGAGTPEDGEAGLLRRILYWTGGHPYLTQRLCRAVAEAAARSRAEVDAACRATFLDRAAGETDANMAFVRHRLLSDQPGLPLGATLLDAYQRALRGRELIRDHPADPVATGLRLSGIVRVEDGVLRVRNRIYAEVFGRKWITENTLPQEVQRQRRAYARGMTRAVSIATAVVALLGFALYQSVLAQMAAQAAAAQSLAEAPGNHLAALTHARDAARIARWMRGDAADQTWSALGGVLRAPICIHQYAEPAGVAGAAYLPDGRRAVIASLDGSWRLWQRDGAVGASRRGTVGRLTGLRISGDGRRVALLGAGGLVQSWSVNRTEGDAPMPTGAHIVRGIAWSGTSLLYAGVGLGNDAIVGTAGAAGGTRLKGHTGFITSAAFSPNGKRLATASLDGTVRLWDLRGGGQIAAGPDLRSAPKLVAFDPAGGLIATADAGGVVVVWRAEGGRTEAAFAGSGEVASMAVSPDGRLCAVAGADGVVRIWPMAINPPAPVATLNTRAGATTTIEFSPDGRRVLIGCDAALQEWVLLPAGSAVGHIEMLRAAEALLREYGMGSRAR
ncbi:MAG: AAA-like domain-containing protein [Armatimonadetes bacterium]|nr:AAA-like domain-containing protein [Armatimonadota bacterium]